MDNATQLHNMGIEPTDNRIVILSHFMESSTPLSAKQLIVKIKGKQINRATVFRILKLFEEKQIIQRIDFSEGESRFEISSLPHHHHAICRTCGSMERIDECSITDMQKYAKKKLGFSILDHSITLFGVCKKCKALV